MILIIDDEKNIRTSLLGLLTDEGYAATVAASAEEGEKHLASQKIDLILLDIQMPGKDGLTFLDDNREKLKNIPVVIISGQPNIATAVSALKLGAADYIEKPLSPERVIVTVRQTLRLSHALEAEVKLTGKLLDQKKIIGSAPVMIRLDELIDKAAAVSSTILITGENGTGKELVAHQIHYRSSRRAEPLITVNCPAVPSELFESELFGHVKGAFTGALSDRPGRFEAVGSGTLFLDEIGELSPAMQSKLLRVLESGQFEKVGSDETINSTCRLIAATNRDLDQMVTDGSFRQDLFYRLNVINITSPPLRERPGDIGQLVSHFLKLFDAHNQIEIGPDAIAEMALSDWPGNIRQLKNSVERLIFEFSSGTITATDIRKLSNTADPIDLTQLPQSENRLTGAVKLFETRFLSELYNKHNQNIAAMARDLNIDRGNLSRKLKALNIV